MMNFIKDLFAPQLTLTSPFKGHQMPDPASPQLATSYEAADPFPHAVVEGMFDRNFLKRTVKELPSPHEKHSLFFKDEAHLQEHKFAWRDVPHLGAHSLMLINALQSKPFLEYLTSLTGIEGLLPDPYLGGAGFHQIIRGGKLAIHADFNIHPQTQMYRRLNVLVYLNDDWDEAWGGHVELWSTDMKRCVQKIAPTFGKMVVFNTTENSYHGHPEPLQCPEKAVRRSLALYYYTHAYPHAEKHSTLWQQRPEDSNEVGQAAAEHKKKYG